MAGYVIADVILAAPTALHELARVGVNLAQPFNVLSFAVISVIELSPEHQQ
jgi:hypothetical protein